MKLSQGLCKVPIEHIEGSLCIGALISFLGILEVSTVASQSLYVGALQTSGGFVKPPIWTFCIRLSEALHTCWKRVKCVYLCMYARGSYLLCEVPFCIGLCKAPLYEAFRKFLGTLKNPPNGVSQNPWSLQIPLCMWAFEAPPATVDKENCP